jgi:hypothetical protein
MTVQWTGDQVREQVVGALRDSLVEFGLYHEGLAKGQLRKGRGVVTGTLRRSVHAAGSAYNFGRDNVPTSAGSPERGGAGLTVEEKNKKLSVVVGSGMRYARRIDVLYAYLTGTYPPAQAQLFTIILKHAAARGLR